MYSLHTTAEKAIVIACNDCISSYLDMNHNNLSKDFVLPGSKDEGMITHFMDKGAMAQLAVKSGLNIPKSIIIRRQILNLNRLLTHVSVNLL